MATEKKIARKGVYTIELFIYEDGSQQFKRQLMGFHDHELLGILELSKTEILNKMLKKTKVVKS